MKVTKKCWVLLSQRGEILKVAKTKKGIIEDIEEDEFQRLEYEALGYEAKTAKEVIEAFKLSIKKANITY